MAEITAKPVFAERNKIYWIPFFAALISAPLLVALLGFWAYVPVFAVAFGAPTYLIFGAPLLALCIRYVGASAGLTMLAAFAANILSYPFVALVQDADFAGFLVGFGMIMAPLWGLVFGLLYSPFSDQ